MFFNSAYAGMGTPLVGTDVAGQWESLYSFLVWLSIFFFVLVVGAMILFAWQYRSRPGLRTKYITGNHLLEGIWIVVPTILLLVIFAWGYGVYHTMRSVPVDAYEIHVVGKQWLWQFQYDNGKTTTGELFVPINKPVKLIMTSDDVLHGFFIPNFRIKQDVVPGMYTTIWFEAKVPGRHQIFCTEYCGTSHSGMLAQVIVLDDQQWNDWTHGHKLGEIPRAGEALAQAGGEEGIRRSQASAIPAETGLTLAEQGRRIQESRGCVTCHSPDGSPKAGPTHKGLFGSTVALQDGSTVVADDNYLRESIESPMAKVVKGFQPVMPTYKGQLSELEINALIAYIKSLK